MASSLLVLGPNGRRHNIKVTPNTTILQVIEEVCKKQGLKPEDYDIKHHNHILDTNALIRFSGLPNNAQLELTAAKRLREESKVTLCLVLEAGERIIGNFHPSDTLWSIITELRPNLAESGTNPVVIYTRREVCGKEELQETTLRHLGLTGGRAILRFLHRTPEELHEQAHVSAPLPHKPSAERITSVSQKLNYSAAPKAEAVESVSCQATTSNVTAPQPQEVPNSLTQQPFNSAPQTEQQLGSCKQEVSHNVAAQEKGSKSHAVKSEPMDVDIVENKPASRTNVIKPLCANAEPMQEEIIQLGERNALAFSLEMAEAVPTEDLPDDFFNLTVDDVRALFRDLKRRREEMDEIPLTTSAQRELEESKRVLRQLNEYRRTVIRVQFPDRVVLQGTFLPAETVSTVKEFVRGYLEDPSIEFYLYTTPPKQSLSPKETLIEAHCVPNAMLYFGSKTPAKGSYLRSDILSKLSSPKAATIAASSIRLQKQTSNMSPSTVSEPEIKEASSRDTENSPSTSSGAKSAKVPKWFKPAK